MRNARSWGRAALHLGIVAVLLAAAYGAPTSRAAFSRSTANTANALGIANSFGLAQNLVGTTGCISDAGTSGACQTDSRASSELFGADVTDDGAHYYATSLRSTTDGGVFGYVRGQDTGELSQMYGSTSCVTNSGDSGDCVTGDSIRNTIDLDVSPDGKNVYVAAFTSWAVAVLTRNTVTGALTQPAHATNDCVSENGGDGSAGSGSCYNGHGMYNPAGVAVSNDGKNVYVAADATDGGSGSVAILDRNTTTGVLTQDATSAGCVSDDGAGTCVNGRGLAKAYKVTVSPDDQNVYVTSRTNHSVAVFSRNSTTGDLTQLAGTAGCYQETGTDGCADGVALQGLRKLVVSPDGTSAYAAANTSDAVVVFDRDTTTGALTQKPGTAGCWSHTGTGGLCTTGVLLDGAAGIGVSPDGQDVYVASPTSASVNAFQRNAATGVLTQIAGTGRCVTDTGSSGVCYNGKGMGDMLHIAVSPDGQDIYATNYTAGGVAFLKRARAASPGGELYGWGDNTTGQVGQGNRISPRTSPLQIGSDATWVQAASGNQPAVDADTGHSCAVRSDDTLWCWGENFRSQLGVGGTTDSNVPVQVTGAWRSVATGGIHTCGIKTDNTLWCWGYNSSGALGLGDNSNRATPTKVGTGTDWNAVAAANVETCGIRGGQLYCWGEGLNYKLGNGATGDQNAPVLISSNTTHTSVTKGRQHGCATRSDGTMWCWGGNTSGQLGRGNTTTATTPTQIGSVTTWTQLAAGRDHTCGLRYPGTLWCWGLNDNYELGLGNTSQEESPIQLGVATDWARVSAANEHTCANRADKTIYCWGANSYGQLGQGDTSTETTPKLVPGRTGTVYTGVQGSATTLSIG